MRFDIPQDRMEFSHESFSECSVKLYQNVLLNQTNLNKSLDDLKARLIFDEGIVRIQETPLNLEKVLNLIKGLKSTMLAVYLAF